MSEIHYLRDLTPILELNLDGPSNLILNFGRETLSRAPQLRIKRHENSTPLTILLDGLQGDNGGFNVVTALQHGLLLLLDATSKDVIDIPPNHVQPRAKTIRPTKTDEVHNISFHPRNEFWKQLVSPGCRYLIRFSESGGLSWCQYGPKEEHSSHLEQDRPESLPLQRGPGLVKFMVRDDPPPPTFTASLSMSSDICQLSAGAPTFELILSITSHETCPITAAVQHTPLYIMQSLDEIFVVEDKNTNQILELPYGVGCFLDNTDSEEFPHALLLQEFLPKEPYARKYGLEPCDPATSNGGELECLSEGHHYSVQLSEQILWGFGSWCWGRESELPKGDPKAIRKRMRGNGAIRLVATDVPVYFTAEK